METRLTKLLTRLWDSLAISQKENAQLKVRIAKLEKELKEIAELLKGGNTKCQE